MVYGSFWQSSGSLNIWRTNLSGCGSSTAALSFGGQTYNFSPHTEQFNGQSWSQANNMYSFRYALGGAGTQCSAIAFGGTEWGLVLYHPLLPNQPLQWIFDIFSSSRVEEYDGTTWWSTEYLLLQTTHMGYCGIKDAALCVGGRIGYNSGIDPEENFTWPNYMCEEFNGSSWYFSPFLISGSEVGASCGTSNSALSFGGNHTSYISDRTTTTESYNGLAWSNGGKLIVGRDGLGGSGTQDAGLSFGGMGLLSGQGGSLTPVYGREGITEEYFGDVWSLGSFQLKARNQLSGCGSCNGLSVGGIGVTWGLTGPSGYTEIYTRALTSTPVYGPIY